MVLPLLPLASQVPTSKRHQQELHSTIPSHKNKAAPFHCKLSSVYSVSTTSNHEPPLHSAEGTTTPMGANREAADPTTSSRCCLQGAHLSWSSLATRTHGQCGQIRSSEVLTRMCSCRLRLLMLRKQVDSECTRHWQFRSRSHHWV
uniref:Uncharacterized protein n=1 Tax=Arundo donax TaxID=35708 RepID=A0A0A8ZN35_ARUDO